MRSFFLALGIGAVCVAAYAGCGLSTEGELADQGPSSTASSGTGGAGGSMPCTDRGQCDPDTDCTTWACVAGNCTAMYLPDETPVQGGTAGDCKKNVCKDGKPAVLPDDTDLVPDNDPCTMEMCNGGVKQAGPAPNGTACGETGKLACVDGRCQGCGQDPTNCNKPTECQDVTCAVNTCEYPIQVGKVLDDSSSTDCKMDVCDAQGNKATIGDTTEMPMQVGDDCKLEICAMDGSTAQMNANEDAKCANSMGMCYNDSVCEAGACTPKPKPTGTMAGDNAMPGDCKALFCDGNGGMMEGPDDSDVPTDQAPGDCLYTACVNGMLSPGTPKNEGDPCADQMNGKCCGTMCCANASAGAGEFCDKNDMCCPSGKTCGGNCCASAGDNCLGGSCCAGTICGNTCCPTDHACEPTSMACCPSNKRCGNNTCCSTMQNCNPGNNSCM